MLGSAALNIVVWGKGEREGGVDLSFAGCWGQYIYIRFLRGKGVGKLRRRIVYTLCLHEEREMCGGIIACDARGRGADWARERGRGGKKKSEPVTLPCLYQTGEGPGCDFLVLTLLDMIRGVCRRRGPEEQGRGGATDSVGIAMTSARARLVL